MSPALHHECTRVPVTALSSCGALLIAAEGPFLRFYHAKDSKLIASRRVFRAQAVHGLSVYCDRHSLDQVSRLVIWGGRLLRAVEVTFSIHDHEGVLLNVHLSDVAKAPDWILDLSPRPSSLDDDNVYQRTTYVAVTAHNALLKIDIERPSADTNSYGIPFILSVSELTASSRSILYSAHVFWESGDCILVAAGTAFGEIMYWSWSSNLESSSAARIHRVFLGHEGSIFGIRISQELPTGCCQKLKRVIASCSDDRTIRVWDVSDIETMSTTLESSDPDSEPARIRHTGFSNTAFDSSSQSISASLAIGWGHSSRVWTVHFMESAPCDGALLILSTGEDATSRTWRLTPDQSGNSALPYRLLEADCSAHHSGKNLWSFTVHPNFQGQQQIICGGADAKITGYRLNGTSKPTEVNTRSVIHGYTVHDILSLAHDTTPQESTAASDNHKSSKKAEFFRSYCSFSQDEFLLTTNSGKIVLVSLQMPSSSAVSGILTKAVLADQLEDLSGYSVCTSKPKQGFAFVAGSRGTIYVYSKHTAKIQRLVTVEGKVGDMFATSAKDSYGEDVIALLTTIVGQKQAELRYVGIASGNECATHRTTAIPISETLTGSLITSMTCFVTSHISYLFVGFRRGSIAIYSISPNTSPTNDSATLFRIIERVHGDETVTALKWVQSSANRSTGHLVSVGRDGRLAVHSMDLLANSLELVHDATLPIGPNIEGLYTRNGHLLVHGFSNKKWVLYDVDVEEEIMGVETGGAHRSWAFQPNTSGLGGTLVWTRASSMHIYQRTKPSHAVIRTGGHGREIKAVAVSPNPSNQLIATGAEDTDIKIFEYMNDDLVCKKTIRKHTTGIQHLQWSTNGEYLFSSGGCEEFYIWRIRRLPAVLDIGVVCEHTYTPESEHSDLRIMSFDVRDSSAGYVIALVFSDSSLKVYRYNAAGATKWQSLAKGLYFTSCLTQCTFTSHDRILTAGTDGHTAVWQLPTQTNGPLTSTSYSPSVLSWQQPIRLHQSSSKSMSTIKLSDGSILVASGGDDGSLAFLRTWATSSQPDHSIITTHTSPPTIINRTHASAVTACALLSLHSHTYVLTSGNDQWVRLWQVEWEVLFNEPGSQRNGDSNSDILTVRRLGKVKTSVADVSSMAVMEALGGDKAARVMICGVGMEVIRVEWSSGDFVSNT